MVKPRTNLVGLVSTFVGRRADLDAIARAFGAGDRLVTITGTAGIGKTRLAREAALALSSDETFAGARSGGTWFVDLTECRDRDDLCAVVAQVLGVPLVEGRKRIGVAEQLGHALAARGPTLLVLDNFEQLVDHAPETVGSWAGRAPNARWLVTSRERLRLDGEIVIELDPLSVSDAESGDASRSEAVELLIDRVRRIDTRYRPDADGALLADIARQLDGIPLAIELAAARLALLGARTLLERLSERLDLLSHGPRGGAARRLTLRSAIGWSWDLLTVTERAALAQCSVFRGGFDLEAAEAVLDLDLEDASTAPAAVDLLQSLYEKSLVRIEPVAYESSRSRFGLYASIRDFAAEHLEAAEGASRGSARRHALHYAERAERWALAAEGPDSAAARRRLLAEKENLKAAVERARLPGPAELARSGLRAALALDSVLSTQGPFEEHLAILDSAVSIAASVAGDNILRGRVFLARGNVYRRVGRLSDARADLEQASAIAHAAEDVALEGRALSAIGSVLLARGSIVEARDHYERALALHRRASDRVHEGLTLASLGAVLAAQGNVAEARARVEEALATYEAAGNLREEGMASAFLGNLALDEGRADEARLCFAHAAAIHRQVGDRFGEGFTTANLAMLWHDTGDLERAHSEYTRALGIFGEIGARRYAGAFSGYLAVVERERGELDAARERLSLAIDTLRDAHDERFCALFTAYLAGVEAERGRISEASRLLASSEARLSATDDPFLTIAARLQGAIVASARGDDADVAARLAAARAKGDGGRSAVDQAGDVRVSLRVVERALGRLVDARAEARAAPSDAFPPETLVIELRGAWLRPPRGERIDLRRRDPLRRLLVKLASERIDRPGAPLAREALVAAAWPGERILQTAAANRLRVAIATLRRLGLGDLLETRDDGYLLAARTPVVLWGEAASGSSL